MNKKEISCRITRTLLMYVRENNNDTIGDLLSNLPLGETYLSDTNNWVSHEFLQILYHRMVVLLKDPNAVYHMTLASGRYQSLGILDRIGKLIGSPRLLYSQAPLYNKFLKLNGSVFIHKKTKTSVILEDRYHDSTTKTRFDCDYTRGILAGIPTIFGLPQAKVEEIKCQVSQGKYGNRTWHDKPDQGCTGCFYRVTWSSKKIPFFKRIFFRRLNYQKAIEDLANANQQIQSKYDEVKNLLSELENKNQQLIKSKQKMESQQNELIESERKYRILAENVSDTIWIMNLKTLKLEYVSPSVTKNRGYTPEEAKELSLDQSLSPPSFEKALKILGEELEKEKEPDVDYKRSRTFEIKETIKGGGYTWAETTVSFVRDQTETPSAIMGVTRYIGERKKAEKKIAQSEKKYRNLFRNGSDLICIHDLKGNILDTNLQYKKEYGWKHEDIMGANIRNLIPKKNQPEFDHYLARILKNGEDEGYLRGQTRSGQKIILEYRNQLIFDENNRPKNIQCSGRDVTKQLMAQKALKESEDKYKGIVQYAPAGIYEFDMETFKFISVNDIMCKYTGYTKEEFLDLNPFDLLSKESKGTLHKIIDTVLSTQPKEFIEEYKLQGKNKHELWVLSNSRFFYEDGIPKRAMAVVHDLTDIRKAEEERRQLEIQLQQAHKMEAIGTLAGGIAHDFNNILAGILGYCDLLKQNINNPQKTTNYISQIHQGAKRAAELVKQILDFSRKTEYKKHPQTLTPIVEEVIKLLRSSIPVTIDIQEDITSQNKVLIDPAKIHQVFMNLCTNAYHSMSDTGGILSISITDTQISQTQADEFQLSLGNYVKLEITDAGHGMDSKTLDRIFDPYFTTKEVGKGTGMGLSVVYAIIREHKGYIEAFSTIKKGSTFVVYLPVTQKEAVNINNAQNDVQVSTKGSERIMIVDDEKSILESTEELLSDYGYQIYSYENGNLALEAFNNNPSEFDLILTDMTMPGISGETLAKKIFKIRKDLPIILCSGYNEKISEAQALEMGITRFIDKPVINQPLQDIIREVLDAKNKK